MLIYVRVHRPSCSDLTKYCVVNAVCDFHLKESFKQSFCIDGMSRIFGFRICSNLTNYSIIQYVNFIGWNLKLKKLVEFIFGLILQNTALCDI